MKVIQVARRFVTSDWGGAETAILETAKRILRAGHNTEIFTTLALAGKTYRETVGGVNVKRFGYFYPYFGLSSEAKRKLDHLGGNLFSPSLLQAILKEPELDLVHLHTSKRLGGIARTAARIRNIPYVVSVPGGLFDVPPEESARLVEPAAGSLEWGRILGWMVGSRSVFQDASLIICVNPTERERIQAAYPQHRVEYLPNGVDVERFSGGNGAQFRARHSIAEDRQIILCVARVDPQKNQHYLVRIIPEIRRQCPEAFLLLIGPSSNDQYADRLTQLITDCDLQNHVLWVPGISPNECSLVDAYHAADVFALSSVHEPFGIVLLEAWAARLPIVANAVGGISAFVDDGVNGVLVATGDEATFVRSIVNILREKSAAKYFGEKGFEKAQAKYSWDSITANLMRLYEEVVHEY